MAVNMQLVLSFRQLEYHNIFILEMVRFLLLLSRISLACLLFLKRMKIEWLIAKQSQSRSFSRALTQQLFISCFSGH